MVILGALGAAAATLAAPIVADHGPADTVAQASRGRAHYVPWLVGAYALQIGSIVEPWFLLLTLPAPSVVHWSYGEPARGAVALVGSGVMIAGGAFTGALVTDTHDDCTVPGAARGCHGIWVGAMVFAALWATADVATVWMSSDASVFVTPAPGVAGRAPHGGLLRLTWSF